MALKGASEGETRESCTAKGGNFTADLRWMMHVWVTPETTENPDGVFAYLNGDLFQKQQAASKTTAGPSGLTREYVVGADLRVGRPGGGGGGRPGGAGARRGATCVSARPGRVAAGLE